MTKTRAETFCKWMGRRLPTEQSGEFAALGKTRQRHRPAHGVSRTARQQRLLESDHDGHLSDGELPTFKTYLGQLVSSDQPGFYDLLGNVWGKRHRASLHLSKRDHAPPTNTRCAAVVRLTVTCASRKPPRALAPRPPKSTTQTKASAARDRCKSSSAAKQPSSFLAYVHVAMF